MNYVLMNAQEFFSFIIALIVAYKLVKSQHEICATTSLYLYPLELDVDHRWLFLF